MEEKKLGIGTQNESSLHKAIKNWYLKPGDKLEEKHEGSIIDIKRGDTLIEIQTGKFSTLYKKLKNLSSHNKVIVVYPIAKEKFIVNISEDGEAIKRRKSNKAGRIDDVFIELMRAPDLICMENITLEILLIKSEEIRCADGKGSWRRKKVSIIDRKLIEVISSQQFNDQFDLIKLLPVGISETFTNKELAKAMGVSISKASKVTYCFRKMDLMKEVGRRGRELLFQMISF